MRKLLFAIALLAALPFGVAAAPAPDTLVKASGPAVYYFATDGKRYAFPNAQTYASWFTDFSGVTTVTDAELAAMPLGGNVTYRPGIRMVKIQSDPKVYAVDRGGLLRWVTTQSLAVALYGQYWNAAIDDVSDAFFANYRVGEPIDATDDFSPLTAAQATVTINADKDIAVSAVTRRSDTEVANVVDGWRKHALDHMNALRSQNGKGPLVMNVLLNRIAMIHSMDMALKIGELAHEGSLGETPDNRIRDGKVPNDARTAFTFVTPPANVGWSGENVGYRYATNATVEQHIEKLHDAFMDEPPDEPNHRTTMLSTLHPYAEVGIGPYVDAQGKFWLTEDFISVE